MTAIAIAAFPDDPQELYRFPHRKEYPEEYTHHVRLGLDEYFNRTAAGANTMVCVEAPDKDDGNYTKVIAFGVWDNPGTSKNGEGSYVIYHVSNVYVTR